MDDIKKGTLPIGLILNLYKYYNPPPCYFKENREFFLKSLENMPKTYTALGNFDRISFSCVNDFAGYREQSSKAYTWLGNRQSILLYPLAEKDRRSFGFWGNQFGLINQTNEFSELQSNYLLITLLYADGETKTSFKAYPQYLDMCAKAVYRVADTYRRIPGKSIGCEVFGTFNSAELAVIWTVDQFVDVLYLIDHLRGLTIHFPKTPPMRAFISSHTFIALGRNIRPGECQDTRGGALIQMAGRTSAGLRDPHRSGYEVVGNYVRDTVRKVENELTNASSDHSTMYCAGEYDIILQTDPQLLPGLFQKPEGNEGSSTFYINDSQFNDHILESTTRLYYQSEDVKELHTIMGGEWVKPGKKGLLNVCIPEAKWCGQQPDVPMNIVSKISAAGEGATENCSVDALFRRLRDQVAALLPASSGFLSTIDLAYSDYVQCSTTTVDHLWVKDFDAQFQAALNILIDSWNTAVAVGDSMTPRSYLDQVQEVLHTLQQQCYHVVDSGKLFFEEPRSHFSYTGQYDLLMHAYYGILKCLLELLYQPPRDQSTIYPLINFGSMPAMSSILYYENERDTPAKSPKRLLVICIPYDAWTSLDHYIPMLIHEIFHYAAPIDRRHRNYLFGCILLTWLHTRILEGWLFDLAAEKKYHRPAYDVITLIVAEAQRIIAQQCTRFVEHLEDDELSGCFKICYITKVVKLLETSLEDDSGIAHGLAAALRLGLEDLPSQEKWAHACNTEDAAAIKETQSLHEQLLKTLKAVEGGMVDPDGIKGYKRRRKTGMEEHWVPMLETLNELFPDIAMVQLAGLDTAGYLLQFSIDQNNKLVEPSDLAVQTYYRLGFIIDWTTGSLQEGRTVTHDGATDCIARLKIIKAQFCARYDYVCPRSTVSAGTWFDFYVKAYQYYLYMFPPYYSWLEQLTFEEYLPCIAKPGDTVNRLTEHCKNYYTILDREDKQGHEDKLFRHTIQLVQDFQQQKDLGTIESAKLVSDKVTVSCPIRPLQTVCPLPRKNKKWKFSLNTHGELHAHLDMMVTWLRESHRKTFGSVDNCKLWFRGCRNDTFDILPSIMVHFADNISAENFNGKNQMGTLLEYQWRLLEEYKFRADGAPELLGNNRYQRLDYLALMQHYGRYTGLLDWSEDAYSSLYFAFEKFVDDASMNIEQDKAEDAPAALYILDPRLYNRARTIMMRQVPNLSSQYLKTIDDPEGYIPNLSIPENRERFAMFIPGSRPTRPVSEKRPTRLLLPPSFVHETGRAPKETELAQVETELRNLPLAIYASRLNPRLRVQSGIFMSYNLRALPIQPEYGATGPITWGDLFHYLSLESIQRFYLDHFDEEPFMLKLSMNKNQKQEMGRILRSLGLNRYRVYPELEHLPRKL